MKCIILAGGMGDSLWPLSRKKFPKQFISGKKNLSTFQETVTRNISFCDEFIIIANKRNETILLGQLQHFQGINYKIYLENVALGTAGAVSFAANLFGPEEELMILPSDIVFGQEGYSDAVLKAKKLISDNRMVLMGVTPNSDSIDYGYIQYKGTTVLRFIEKPSPELAKRIFGEKDILWNCGVLLSKAGILTREIENYCPQINRVSKRLAKKAEKTKLGNKVITAEGDFQNNSFYEKVLEQSKCLSVVKLHADWINLNDFDSYMKLLVNDNENVITHRCDNVSVINKTDGRLIVANRLKDTVIVNTPDSIYISSKDFSNDIKEIIGRNYNSKKNFFDESPLVYRPWGTRELIQSSEEYRVRRLVLYPGMKLSYHKYKNRNESYTVIRGNLTIELDDDKAIELETHKSYNVLPLCNHRLRNNTDDTVIVIQIDTGLIKDEADRGRSKEKKRESVLPDLLKLKPAYKNYIWGGDILRRVYGKESPYDITAESWELSAHPDGSSQIEGGILDGMLFKDFIEKYGDNTCGWKSRIFDRFPILIKFIDARNALSVQIHPDDDYAMVNENEFGKSELWYVMDCGPNAFLYCGLKREVSKKELRKRIERGTLTEVLNKVMVKPGDVIFVPAGTIHAIGGGILICEIQQNSNCTYRLYDYGRRDKNGDLRELHIDKGMDVVNIEPYFPDVKGFGKNIIYEHSVQRILCRCKYFQVTKYNISNCEIIQVDDSSFKSIVVLSGNCKIRCRQEEFEAKAGDSYFITAGKKRVHVEGNCQLVVTNI